MGTVVHLSVRDDKAVPKLAATLLWIRTIARRAVPPTLIGMGCLALLRYAGVSTVWWWLAAACWFALMMTMPLAEALAFVPGETWIERRAREREQAKARAELAEFGLTPEQYIATIPQGQYLRRWKAADRFGVDAT